MLMGYVRGKGLVEWKGWKPVAQWKLVAQKFEKGWLSVVEGNRPFHLRD